MTPEEIEAMQKSNTELAEKLKAAEAAAGGGDESRKRLDYLEGEHKKLIEARDKAKNDMRLADEKKLTEQGEFKIIADNKQKELDDLTKHLESLTGTIAGYTERDEAKLKTLLELIPENQRDTVASNSGTLADKIALAEMLAIVKLEGPGARNAGPLKTQTLQDEYDQAVKDGNVTAQIAIKNEMYTQKG